MPADPGGSYDLYARLVSRFLPKHVPGNPNIIVQNMPGGGGLRAVSYNYSVAPKDGTAMMVPIQDMILTEVLGGHGVDYKSADFNWIGRMSSTVDITLTWHDSPVKTIADAQRISVPIAGTGPTSPTVMNHVVLNNVIGTKFKIVPGYKASNDMLAATEKREVDGAFSSWTTLKASYPHGIADKKVQILTVYGRERFSELPDVPAAVEFARTPEERAILELVSSTGFVGRSLVMAPGSPADRVAAVRSGFEAMLTDPDFLDALAKTKAEFSPLSGAEMQKFADSIRALSPALIERARDAVKLKLP
ncbi:MAG: tripartite tricarboxylate transporter family receptor [Frankiales bacterium]|nr:tripartite tricarboxylate transporter family receptor [Frankiales bacterium]